jgi:hypothetical protein
MSSLRGSKCHHCCTNPRVKICSSKHRQEISLQVDLLSGGLTGATGPMVSRHVRTTIQLDLILSVLQLLVILIDRPVLWCHC